MQRKLVFVNKCFSWEYDDTFENDGNLKHVASRQIASDFQC